MYATVWGEKLGQTILSDKALLTDWTSNDADAACCCIPLNEGKAFKP